MMSQGGSALTYSQIKKSFEFLKSLDSTLETAIVYQIFSAANVNQS